MPSFHFYFYAHDIFINGVLGTYPRLNLKYALHRSEEVSTLMVEGTQLVKIKSPLAAHHASLGLSHLNVTSMCSTTCVLEVEGGGQEGRR